MKALFLIFLFFFMVFVPQLVLAQKGSSIVIHDNTTKANGGENATAKLRSEIESA